MEIDNSPLPPDRITQFIRKHHVLTLATSSDDGLWCSNLFYAYLREENALVFTSDDHTRHVREMAVNPRVAASVVLETRTVGKVQGLQITGTVERDPGDVEARTAYLRRFPYAAVAELRLWILRPDSMKLTDNTLGFGKKIAWSASPQAE